MNRNHAAACPGAWRPRAPAPIRRDGVRVVVKGRGQSRGEEMVTTGPRTKDGVRVVVKRWNCVNGLFTCYP